METKTAIKLIFGVVLFFIVTTMVRGCVSWVTVEGDEAVVRQHWKRGVDSDVLLSGTHFMFPAIEWTGIYKYKIGTQKVTFDSSTNNHGAEYPSIDVNVGEGGGQKISVRISLNYRIGYDQNQSGGPVFSPSKLVALHKSVGREYEDVILKRTIVEVVNRVARPKKALDIFSGAGYNQFVKEVEDNLISHELFKEVGIFVENVIVYGIDLDPAYEKKIEEKQLAIQKTLVEIEERKASEEKAKRIFADSQSEVEKTRQIAEGEKIKLVKAAEAQAEQQVLQAEAEKKKRVLEAEGQRDASLAKASGILAEGEAQAKVNQLLRDASYAGESGARKAQVEIATKQAEKIASISNKLNIVTEKSWLNLTAGVISPNPTVQLEDKN